VAQAIAGPEHTKYLPGERSLGLTSTAVDPKA
jgi:hypothetical protein